MACRRPLQLLFNGLIAFFGAMPALASTPTDSADAPASPPAVAETAAAPNAASIYHIKPFRDGAVIALTDLWSAYAYLNSERLIHPRCPCDRGEVNALDRGAIGNENPFLGSLSDVTVAAAVLFPAALDWRSTGFSRAFAEDMTVYAEVLSVNGGLVTLAKYAAQRPLPRTYAGDAALVDNPHGYRSFYSGHTSITASALTAAAMTYDYREAGNGGGGPSWPWIVDGVVTASVAFERVADGRHFFSDVLVGALAGTAVGISVPYFHHRTGSSSGGTATGLSEPRTRVSVALAPFDDGVLGLAKITY